jgi:long-chain acyl-CoA synthetase
MFAQSLARTAQIFGNRPAVISPTGQVTWREFSDQIQSVAKGLRNLGLEPGDRVAVLAENSVEHLTIMYAVAWAGCVLVPLNTRLSTHEMTQIAKEAGVAALAGDSKNKNAFLSLVGAVDQTLELIDLDGDTGLGAPLAELVDNDGLDPWKADMSDIAALFYTGGTTGRPKGVMVSDGALTVQTLNLVNDLSISSETVYVHAPPIFHLAGAGVSHACSFTGATHIFPAELSPETFIRTVTDYTVTLVSLIPTMLADMMEAPNVREAFKAVQTIVYGAAPISEALLRKVIGQCPDVNLVQIYGQTECTGPCLILPPERHTLSGPLAGKLNTAGRANMTSEVRIADETGKPTGPGVAGEVLIRGPSVMQGYWKQPEITEQTMKDGWLHTGDVGVMDTDGYIRIVDRLKDMIVTGGENVFCGEVENAISEHQDAIACAVVGIPDEKWGERVHAFVVVTEETILTEGMLRDHCKTLLAGYKCPRSATFTTEPLPLSAVGKVRKDLLRNQITG